MSLGWLVALLAPLLGVLGAWHALLYKRDPRSALGWIAVCLLLPFGGVVLYGLMGVNRVRTRGRRLRRLPLLVDYERPEQNRGPSTSAYGLPEAFQTLARVGDAVARLPCLPGNRVTPLRSGDETYPAMLAAIRSAERCVHLSTYIFGTRGAAQEVMDALAAAVRRGVAVRVLLDGAGEWYTLPRAGPRLAEEGVHVARFLPPRLWPPALHLNLRNHRKILLVDDTVAFMGGINIADYHVIEGRHRRFRVTDLHFRLEGPVVGQVAAVFAEDWRFATGEVLPVVPMPGPHPDGAWCRTIADGPNEDMDRLAMVLLGAVSAARARVGIMTPYFLPSRELIGALQAAALRGVRVTVVLPARNNWPPVHWATRNLLWELLEYGVEVHYQPPPFAHAKLFLVDDGYAQLGSANLDPRSLRLNFELNFEVYDTAFCATLWAHLDAARSAGRPVSSAEIEGRSLPARTRDALCWLLSPYL